ncbi:MAG: cytochrome d ubiquinol oxidase subunit II [Rubrimonas sp.]|uniref:cytochrome d ubiquinol oxidase subunit II n=1 Tax=Rubrimonas sp. TaxID=2036015 RepID=UPI002FDEBD8C
MILHELMDYETLRVIWWVLLGVLLIAFAATDGFDMGVGTLLPFVGKTDLERRVAINTVGPVWEGNQVWFILGGGAIFAAFPTLYAVSFSGFYLAMFVVLASLILRPVAFKYRSKRDDPKWRNRWDWALFVGGTVPPVIFGVAIGNTIQGAPFRLNDDLLSIYEGSFFALLDPISLLFGLTALAMTVMHGGAWLGLKADGPVAERGRAIGEKAALAVIALFALNGLILATLVPGYQFVNPVDTAGPSNPLFNEVARGGSWLSAYAERPWIVFAPIMGFAGAAGAWLGLRARNEGLTFLSSSASVAGMILTVGLTMFPFILPSTLDPNSSLTVWDSTSSHKTLFIMLFATAIFLPLILLYTAWVYKVLWGKVDEDSVAASSDTVY